MSGPRDLNLELFRLEHMFRSGREEDMLEYLDEYPEAEEDLEYDPWEWGHRD